jgi:hypothetical protein
MAEATSRDISQDSKALCDLLYQTQQWCERQHYLPMHAKFALLWVYGMVALCADRALARNRLSTTERAVRTTYATYASYAWCAAIQTWLATMTISPSNTSAPSRWCQWLGSHARCTPAP